MSLLLFQDLREPMPTKKKRKKGPIICAFDTEIEYDTDYSLKHMSTRQVVEHEKFKCYLCTFANDDFTEGLAPEDVDWLKYDGATFICHNASFDQYVFEQLQIDEIIPNIEVTFICSADMVSYFQLPRYLSGALQVVFGYDMPKDMRDWMKGKTWQDAVDSGKSKELLQYGIDDAIWTWKLYKELYHKWPEDERELSRINREMCWEGLPIDVKALRSALKSMEKKMWELQKKLPWVDVVDPDTKKTYAVTGKKGLNTYLKKEGLPTITSTAKDSDECHDWIANYGTRCSYVADFQSLVRMNKHYASLKKMYERVDDRFRFSYGLLQYGVPSTQRWRGTGGWSVHNGFPREVQHGVDIRAMLRAPKDHSLIVSDLSQIEPRCSSYIVGDEDALKAFKKGMSPYEYHALATMNWNGKSLKKEDPNMYALAKERVLSLGYGVGWARFMQSARNYGFGSVLDQKFDKFDENAFLSFLEKVPSQSHYIDTYDLATEYEKRCMINSWIQVMDFRKKSPLIKGMWDYHAEQFKKAASEGENYSIELPSGREMKFFKPRPELQGISCAHVRGDKFRTREYGASLYQKSIQATARDVFAFHLKKLNDEGVKVIMHVHDEIVAEVHNSKVDDVKKVIEQVMTTPPSWAKIPLKAEAVVSETYFK